MATGLLSSLQQYNPTADMTQQTYTPQTREVDAATETVEGRVNSMMGKDNELMQRARAQAQMGAAGRGLVNSSLAAGAGTAAMLDKATEIAKADADVYNQRAIANMGATNDAGIFNTGENNKLVSQGIGIAGQFGLQKDQQSFTADQTIAQNNFTAAQSDLDRAQQVALADKSIEAQQALQRAQQVFDGAQAELTRVNQRYLQTDAQQFQGAQNELDRAQQEKILQANQNFQMAQNELDRAQQVALADKSIEAQMALQTAQQNFQTAQNALDRAQQMALQSSQQAFQSGENAADRAQQSSLQTAQLQAQRENTILQQEFTRAQNELDRAQQAALADKSLEGQIALQKAQQEFTKAENDLDRGQQASLANLQIAAQKTLQENSQEFSKIQATLDRNNQKDLVMLQDSLGSANVSKTYAANISLNTLNALNTIQLDPNMTPEAKAAATTNAIGSANASLQWGATFYNTPLPGMSGPGETAGLINPVTNYDPQAEARQDALVKSAYASIGRTGVGTGMDQIDQAGLDWWKEQLKSGNVSEAEFNSAFNSAVDDYVKSNPDSEYAKYVSGYRG